MSVSFEELLARDGRLVYKTRGVSMEPMLRQARDLVIIEPSVERLKRYDVALYKRGKKYVLHRVVGVRDGYYLIRGDNTYCLEKVPDGAVLGVLTGFVRKGKQYRADNRGYRFYVRVWHAVYPLRYLYVLARSLAVAAARKMGILPLIKKLVRREGRQKQEP